MFEGSAHHDHGFFPPLQEAGASLNGSTNADRTNYWEVVPTGALELALWLESDRMGYLLPALTQAKFDTQREVVINERRQNYENRPYGLAGMAMSAAVYASDHPYHWPTIGFTPDLRAASLADVRGFFSQVLPSGQRLAGAGRGHRHPGSPRPGARLLRRFAARARPSSGRGAAGRRAHERGAPGPRGSRRAAPPLSGVALAGAVRRRRRSTRSGRRRARQRQDLAPLPHARARAARRARRLGGPAVARARGVVPDRGHRRTRPRPRRDRPGDHGSHRRGVQRRTDRRRDGTRASPRPRRTSSTGCRPWGDSAASPTS